MSFVRRITRKLISSKKGVAEIISYAIIAILSMALVGTAYTWGMPLITKRQDRTKVERIYNYFNEDNYNSLVRKIEQVAKNGGREVFAADVDGMWELHEYDEAGPDNNSLEFHTFSKVTNVAMGDWSSLTFGGSCPPLKGIVGIDSPFVVCGKAEDVEDGFNIVYRIWPRTVLLPTGAKGYKINFIKDPTGQMASTHKTVTLSRENVYTCSPPDSECPTETLIITKIKILLA